MKTTDLIFQNQKVLNALQEMLLQTKKHVEFLATNAPEIRASLESIAESLQTGADILENQINNSGSRRALKFLCSIAV